VEPGRSAIDGETAVRALMSAIGTEALLRIVMSALEKDKVLTGAAVTAAAGAPAAGPSVDVIATQSRTDTFTPVRPSPMGTAAAGGGDPAPALGGGRPIGPPTGPVVPDPVDVRVFDKNNAEDVKMADAVRALKIGVTGNGGPNPAGVSSLIDILEKFLLKFRYLPGFDLRQGFTHEALLVLPRYVGLTSLDEFPTNPHEALGYLLAYRHEHGLSPEAAAKKFVRMRLLEVDVSLLNVGIQFLITIDQVMAVMKTCRGGHTTSEQRESLQLALLNCFPTVVTRLVNLELNSAGHPYLRGLKPFTYLIDLLKEAFHAVTQPGGDAYDLKPFTVAYHAPAPGSRAPAAPTAPAGGPGKGRQQGSPRAGPAPKPAGNGSDGNAGGGKAASAPAPAPAEPKGGNNGGNKGGPPGKPAAPQSGDPTTPKAITCRNCSAPGHIAKVCPKPCRFGASCKYGDKCTLAASHPDA
jgi:hypothetical protein